MRNKRDIRHTYFLIAFICFYSLTSSCFPRCTLIELKARNQIDFFALDFTYICDELVGSHSSLLCKFYTISKFKGINNKSFHRILFTLLGRISLNPGHVYNSQSFCLNELIAFKPKGIHLIHLNINSLLPKINEIFYEDVHINVIEISESKLDETIFQSEI